MQRFSECGTDNDTVKLFRWDKEKLNICKTGGTQRPGSHLYSGEKNIKSHVIMANLLKMVNWIIVCVCEGGGDEEK
jgi:hypothetical protein